MTIESNGAAVANRTWSQSHYDCAKHPRAHDEVAIFHIQMKFHWCVRQQPVSGFDECTARRNIDERGRVTRSNPGRHNPVFVDRPVAPVATSFARELVHNGFHCCVRLSKRKMRTLPVSPTTRMTY